MKPAGRPAAGPLLLGIDVGSTLVKALVCDASGNELALGRATTPWRACSTGAEADPGELFEAVVAATRHALELAGAEPGSVAGVGVSSFAESLVLLDARGEPAAPVIAWYDRRGDEEAASLGREIGAEQFAAFAGLPLSVLPGIVKLAWLMRRLDPAPVVARVLSFAEYVAFRLGGEQAAELSLATRTGALDITRRAWRDEMVAWSGLDIAAWPTLVPAGTLLGAVGARLSGLERLAGAAIAVGGHDHLCASAGAGVLGARELLDSCGTAEAYVRAVEPLSSGAVLDAVRNDLAVSCHVIPGHHALVGGRPFGLVLGAVRDLIGGIPGGASPVETASVAPRAGGQATPNSAASPVRQPGIAPSSQRLSLSFDASGLAVLSGIGPGAGPADAWAAATRAVLEVSMSTYEHLARVGGRVEEVVLTGGWSEVEPVRGAKLALFPRCVRPAVSEAGGRGAALFGGCAAGLFDGPASFPKPAYELLSPGRAAPERAG